MKNTYLLVTGNIKEEKEMKKYDEIKKLNGEALDDDSFNELMENENIVGSECLGDSGYCHSYYWYSVKLSDGTEIDIYC